jgi:hypothetical protein
MGETKWTFGTVPIFCLNGSHPLTCFMLNTALFRMTETAGLYHVPSEKYSKTGHGHFNMKQTVVFVLVHA